MLVPKCHTKLIKVVDLESGCFFFFFLGGGGGGGGGVSFYLQQEVNFLGVFLCLLVGVCDNSKSYEWIFLK